MISFSKVETDIIVDLQYGDSGKGKVAHFLCKTKKYTHVLRYNGGCNAGHTIFHKGKKFITHHIPAGVFWGIKSIIGPGCVVDPVQFLKEIKMLEDGGIKTKGKIFVAKNTQGILCDESIARTLAKTCIHNRIFELEIIWPNRCKFIEGGNFERSKK